MEPAFPENQGSATMFQLLVTQPLTTIGSRDCERRGSCGPSASGCWRPSPEMKEARHRAGTPAGLKPGRHHVWTTISPN